MFDLIIIGGGPAGITAGIYAARKKLNTLLITKDFLGQVSHAFFIENYPGFKRIKGMDLIKKFKNHLEKFKIDVNQGESVVKIQKKKNGFEVFTNQGDKYQTKTIIIATGAKPRQLGIEGEIKFLGRGVSYCPVCDGFLFSQKDVAVIGGGNSGCEAALYLLPIAKKIYLLEASNQLRADQITQEKIFHSKKIEVIFNAKVKEIKGSTSVEKILFEQGKEKREIPVEGVFIQIGMIPDVEFAKKLVKTDKAGKIIINPRTCETSTKGIFAAGDVTNTLYHQIVIAAAQGAIAALSAAKYLEK